MVILGVRLEVLGQVVDPLAEDGHLHFGGAGVRLVRLVGANELRFAILRQSQRRSSTYGPVETRPPSRVSERHEIRKFTSGPRRGAKLRRPRVPPRRASRPRRQVQQNHPLAVNRSPPRCPPDAPSGRVPHVAVPPPSASPSGSRRAGPASAARGRRPRPAPRRAPPAARPP